MTSPSRTFDTGISRSRAVLAEPPPYWSYSALREVAACPLRYCLEHASYPDLWSHQGYPALPSPASLFGNVVHGALEVILKALSEAAVSSPSDEKATHVLMRLGGLRAVIESETDRQLEPLEENPRLGDERKRRVRRQLREQTQNARAQVQTYLSRTQFVPGPPRAGRATSMHRPSAGPERQELADGSHAEVRLVVEDLRLHGRVDLLMIHGAQVEIVDFKTGAESPNHADQLRLYALLWSADEEANPRQTPATRLSAAYRDHDIDIDVPDPAEMARLSATVAAEISIASREASSDSPAASPAADTCASCSVRHLCHGYWASVAPRETPVQDDCWFDFEGAVGEENGQRSWWLLDAAGRRQLLLRSATNDPGFAVGNAVRLLGLHRESDPDVAFPIGAITPASEVFVLEASG